MKYENIEYSTFRQRERERENFFDFLFLKNERSELACDRQVETTVKTIYHRQFNSNSNEFYCCKNEKKEGKKKEKFSFILNLKLVLFISFPVEEFRLLNDFYDTILLQTLLMILR